MRNNRSMFASDNYGMRAADAMREYYSIRSEYRERKTKRGRDRLDAKARKVSELMRKSMVAYMCEVAQGDG